MFVPVLNARVERAVRRGDEVRAEWYAADSFHRSLKRHQPCEWCGEMGSDEDPVQATIVSPPCSGYPVDEMWAHARCASEAAKAAVL